MWDVASPMIWQPGIPIQLFPNFNFDLLNIFIGFRTHAKLLLIGFGYLMEVISNGWCFRIGYIGTKNTGQFTISFVFL